MGPVDRIPEIIEKVTTYTSEVETDLRDRYPDNQRLSDRLDVIKKYNNMNILDILEELKEDAEENKDLIKRYEQF